MPPVALTIAGSDCSGGAGIQADLKTFHQLGVYGTSAITLITVQNTTGISHVEVMPGDLVAAQVQAVLDDLEPAAAKTGALGNTSVIEAAAAALRVWSARHPLIIDPAMLSKHGGTLLDPAALAALCDRLLPLAALVTPNLAEAAELAQIPVTNCIQMREAAKKIAAFGPRAVLVKGGHLEGDAVDILYADGVFSEFRSPRVHSGHTHGTGCTYSAAITALLARGFSLTDAIGQAKIYITEAIATAPGLGSGYGPVNHWATGTLST